MTLRCLVYSSNAVGNWTRINLQALLTHSKDRNAQLGITGFLLYLGGTFTQVLEGPPLAIDQVYRSIAADPRHTDLVVMLDRIVEDRSFSQWSMELFPNDDPAGKAMPLLANVIAEIDHEPGDRNPHAAAVPKSGARGLRVRIEPRQLRARQTVQRVLDSSAQLLASQGPANLSLDMIARAAGVSTPTAYRYFADVDAVFRALIQLAQARCMETLCETLETASFTDDEDIAQTITTYVVNSYLVMVSLPSRVTAHLFRYHHEINWDELWGIGTCIHGAMRRCKLPSANGVSEPDLALVVAAMMAACKLAALRDKSALGGEAFQRTLSGLFLGALKANARPEPVLPASAAH